MVGSLGLAGVAAIDTYLGSGPNYLGIKLQTSQSFLSTLVNGRPEDYYAKQDNTAANDAARLLGTDPGTVLAQAGVTKPHPGEKPVRMAADLQRLQAINADAQNNNPNLKTNTLSMSMAPKPDGLV